MSALHIRIGRGASRLPADVALSMIPSLPRPVLERLAQSIIDRLDDMDGDPDLEPNGDEQDHGAAEDDWRQIPPAAYDGEDCGVIILPAPKGIQPTLWRVT